MMTALGLIMLFVVIIPVSLAFVYWLTKDLETYDWKDND